MFRRAFAAGFGATLGVVTAAAAGSVLAGMLAQREMRRQLKAWSATSQEWTDRIRAMREEADPERYSFAACEHRPAGYTNQCASCGNGG